MSILPRDRVSTALAHRQPDRVPLDFWAVPEVWEKLFAHFSTRDEETVLRQLGVDIRQVQPEYIGPPLRTLPDGTFYDPMGCHRRLVKNDLCTYDEYASYPLADAETIEELESYPYWPDPRDYDYASLPQRIGKLKDTHYIKLETGGIFEFAWALRGMENFMMDMILQPEIPRYIMQKLTDFYIAYVDNVMQAAGEYYDMVYTYDDIAGQHGLLLSRSTWEEMIRPYHQQLNAAIKRHGKTIMYHSCGAIFDMIPALTELPIDVLNPLQPKADGMDFEKIKVSFGKELSFHGGIDIQELLPRGTQEQVRQAVRHAIDTLGPGGGYILSSAHYIQADTPVDNILAMYDEARNYHGAQS